MPQVHRVRRLATTAALLVAGALVLAGCRSDPQVAAYVGDTRYSQDRVTAIADEAQDKLQQALDGQSSAGGASSQPVERPVSDQEVVAALVGRDVLKALAEDRKINPLQVDANQMAQQVRVPPDTEYVRALTERDGYRLGLLQQWKSAEPSEADLREVYDNLVKGTGGQYTDSFEQFTSSLPDQSVELVGRSAALRKEIEAEARKLDVTVNPRYGPAVVSLVNTSSQQGGPLISLIDVQLNSQESGVRDVS
jgi:hypothetical protein